MESPIRYEPLFRVIARKLAHLATLGKSFESYSNQFNWTLDHWTRVQSDAEDSLDYILRNYLPSGSGIDNGTKLNEASRSTRLIFDFGFHHMDEWGFYDGWTEHSAIVTPSLEREFDLRITGRNRNEIKDSLHETFDVALSQGIDAYEWERRERLGGERYRRLVELTKADPTKSHLV